MTRRPQHDRPGAGRPTRAEAQLRQEHLLECALEEFLDRGYERATIESIAAAAGMAKRTIYAKYADKATLFKAAVERAVDAGAVDDGEMRGLETDDLADTLEAVARLRVASVTSTEGVRLQRILNAESYRFAEIANLAYERGTLPAIEFVAEVLARHSITGGVGAEALGNAYMLLAVGGPAQAAMRGAHMLPSNDEWIRVAVRLFLDGVRPR